MQLASAAYQPEGYVLDFFIVPDTAVTTFQTGITYYVKSSSNGTTATFQSNTVIKFKNNAYLLLYGTMNFPASQPYAVFTSRDDDVYGEGIAGVPGEANSDGNPIDHQASQAIWIYYVNASKTISNARVRWAVNGIQFDGNTGVNVTHTLSNDIFDQCQAGLRNNLPSGSVILSGVKQCGVTTAVAGSGSITGSMTIDCGVANASKFTGHQVEPGIARNPLDPLQIVIVSMDTNTSPVTLLKMRSDDGGVTWPPSLRASLPLSGMTTPRSDPDPDLVWDPWGNLFLTYIADAGGGGFPLKLYVSNNAGTTWTEVPGLEGTVVEATPKLAVGPLLGSPLKSSLWLSYSALSGGAYAAGIEVRGAGTGSMGPSWTGPSALPNSASSIFTSIAVGPAGEVAVSHAPRNDVPPTPVLIAVNETGLASTTFLNRASASFNLRVGTEAFSVNGGLEMAPIPYLDWDRGRNKLYIVYPDRPTGNSTPDTDIFVRYSTDKAVSWIPSGADGTKVNTGAVDRTEFHPRIAVDQNSGFVGVVWYDCRNDSLNSKAHVFAAVSTNGFATAQPRNFQLNPAWSDVAAADHTYKEYIGLKYQSGFLYPAWLDNSNYKQDAASPTNEFEIYTGRIPF